MATASDGVQRPVALAPSPAADQLTKICDALETHDERAAREGLVAAARDGNLWPVLTSQPRGRPLYAALAESWSVVGSPLSGSGGRLPDALLSEIVGTVGQTGDVVAAAAILSSLAGRAGAALLAHEAFAVRAAARDPAMLEMVFGFLPHEDLPYALASKRGEVLGHLFERTDTDALLGRLIGEIVATGDAKLATQLLREEKHLLWNVVPRRRLAAVIETLVELAGPEAKALVSRCRQTAEKWSKVDWGSNARG